MRQTVAMVLLPKAKPAPHRSIETGEYIKSIVAFG